ncbi:MAG: holo-ACP synthase [Treponema sp.]|nr:holo-ACP synthase [Treponema sp.]
MIFGIGTDIAKVSRFEKWVRNPEMLARFFHACEIVPVSDDAEREKRLHFLSEHYAARFAAKEAFSKALGTGFVALELADFGIQKNTDGKPEFAIGQKTAALLDKRCGINWNVHVSISHEKEFATAFVVIEIHGTDCARG